MRPPITPRPRQLLHAALAAACLAACQVPPPPPAATPGPTEAPPTTSPSPSPSTRPVPPPDAPLLIVTDGVVGKAFKQLDDWPAAFAPGAAPAVQVKDVAGLTAQVAEARIREILREFPDARRVGLAFGAGDLRRTQVGVQTFTASLVAIARAVLADGREPVFARTQWAPPVGMAPAPAYNQAIASVEAVVGLAPGPDLYGYFYAHPDEIVRNSATPTAAGEAAIRRLWAENLVANAPAPAPKNRPQITPTSAVLLMAGDSITYQSFAALADWPGHFAGADAPQVRNFGVPGEAAAGAMLRFEDSLALNPDAGLVGLAWGTNDARAGLPAEAYEASMRAFVTKARDAGRVPILGRIAWRSIPPLPVIPVYNTRLAALEREYGLPAGPDLYTWFQAHPAELSADGLHPTPAGEASIRRLWAEAVARAVAPEAPPP